MNINNIDDFFEGKTLVMRIVNHITADVVGLLYIGTENNRYFCYLRQNIFSNFVYKLPVNFNSIEPGENYYLEKERIYEFLDIMFKDFDENNSEIDIVKDGDEWKATLRYVTYINGEQNRDYIHGKSMDRMRALNNVLIYTETVKNLYCTLKEEFEKEDMSSQEKYERLEKHLSSSNPIIQISNGATINSFPLFPNENGKLDAISEKFKGIDGFVFENDNADLGEKGLYVRELNGTYRHLSDEAGERLVRFINEEYNATLGNMGFEYNTKCICKKKNALVWQTKMWFGVDRKFAIIGYGTDAKGNIDSMIGAKNKVQNLFLDYLL